MSKPRPITDAEIAAGVKAALDQKDRRSLTRDPHSMVRAILEAARDARAAARRRT